MVDAKSWQQHRFSNRMQTFILLASMMLFLGLLGWVIAGKLGIFVLLFSGLFIFLLSPNISPLLIMRMYRAQPLTWQQLPGLYQALEVLAERSGLKNIPRLYYVPSKMINAFAVGRRDQAVIAITDGFLKSFSIREAIAVLAHEISHIRSDDMRVMGLADMVSRLTSTLSLFGQILLLINLPLLLLGEVTISWLVIILLILAPQFSLLAQLGLSRTREFDADLNSALLTGDPKALASALVKIDKIQGGWIERMIMPGRKVPEPSWLRTHPPTEERVQRLLSLEQQQEARYPDISDWHYNALFSDKPRLKRPGWHINGLWH